MAWELTDRRSWGCLRTGSIPACSARTTRRRHWARHTGCGADRVTRLGEKDNFWAPRAARVRAARARRSTGTRDPAWGAAAPTARPGASASAISSSTTRLPQYRQRPTAREAAPNRGIDRAGVGATRDDFQGAPSIYDIDLLRPIGDAVKRMGSGQGAQKRRGKRASRVITDHVPPWSSRSRKGSVISNEDAATCPSAPPPGGRFGRDLEIKGRSVESGAAVVGQMVAYEE